MPFIIAGLALIGALIYGAVRLYATVAAAFGWIAGTAAVVFCAALLAAFVASLVRRYRAIHGVKVKGERILSLEGSWGKVRVDPERKRGALDVDGQQTKFIFADIAGASALENGGKWKLALRLEHNAQGGWNIPMANRKEALRWVKIFDLAAVQKL
ncbi:membrane protein [Burkholderiaceae bacterium 16]|nr:membrane protein [Burkholderiaceae bacterium 16]